MAKICVYEVATGRPRWNTECPDGMEGEQIANLPWAGYVAADPPISGDTEYVTDGRRAPRPALPTFDRVLIAAGGDDAAVLAVDRPFVATIDGAAQAIDTADPDGLYRLEVAASIAAEYRVDIEAWPYLPASYTVTAQ